MSPQLLCICCRTLASLCTEKTHALSCCVFRTATACIRMMLWLPPLPASFFAAFAVASFLALRLASRRRRRCLLVVSCSSSPSASSSWAFLLGAWLVASALGAASEFRRLLLFRLVPADLVFPRQRDSGSGFPPSPCWCQGASGLPLRLGPPFQVAGGRRPRSIPHRKGL